MNIITTTDRLETLANGEIVVSYVKKTYYYNILISIGYYNDKEELHKGDDKPAIILYNKDGIIFSEHWYQNGKSHRDNQPGFISYYNNGIKHFEHWYQNGKLHREDKPAVIHYRDDGTKISEHWYQNGKLHRDDQPARIVYHKNGTIYTERWYQNDELINPRDVLLNKIKNASDDDIKKLLNLLDQ